MEQELEKYLCGKRLGFGCYREVFNFTGNDKYVIKIAINDEGRSINLMEDYVWGEIQHSPLAKWFAPVISVSHAGKYLLQRKIERFSNSQYPQKIPAFFTDTKYDNFGWLDEKRFVCCDFGSFNFFQNVSLKMKKADWWG